MITCKKNPSKNVLPILLLLPALSPVTSNAAKAAQVQSPAALGHYHAHHHGHHHAAGVSLTGRLAPHQHRAGEWMFGVTYKTRDYSGMYSGSTSVTSSDLSAAGFSMTSTTMRMDMTMLHWMYALSDAVTMVVMPHYMQMDMEMKPVTHSASMHAMAGSGAQGMPMFATGMQPMHSGSMTARMMDHSAHGGGAHDMSVSGWGDTVLGVTARLHEAAGLLVQANLHLSAPTGSVTRKQASGRFLPYGMQLGTGTWDALPALTVTKSLANGDLVGGRISTRLPLESDNKSGFAFGESYTAEAWVGFGLIDKLAASVRLAYEKENPISGHYNGPHNHASPMDFQSNYGGEFVDLGIGLHVNTALAGLQLGLEWIIPVSEHYNGFQLGRDQGIVVDLSWSL